MTGRPSPAAVDQPAGARLSVAVVGPGAVGLVVAAALIDAGHRPLLAARTPFDRIDYRPEGGNAGRRRRADVGVDFDLLTDPEAAPQRAGDPVDVVFVATKIHQTAEASPWLAALCGAGSVVAAVQNGIDHRERFSAWVAADAVAPVVVNLPADRTGPGVVVAGGRPNLTVPDDPAGSRVAAALSGSFLPVVLLDDRAFATALWTKLAINSSLGVLGVLTGAPNGSIADPDARWLFRSLVDEVAMVAAAEGVDLPADLADRLYTRIVDGAPDHRSSIAVDRAAGRPTEWRARNQVVVDLAERHGIAVPLNRAGTTLIRLGEPTGDSS